METPSTPVSPPSPSSPGESLPDEGWVTAHPPRAREVFGRVLGFPRMLVEHRDLIQTSVKRELQARFTGTALGWFWPLLHPLFLFAVYYFIFSKLLQVKFGELPPEQQQAFAVFMFVGVVVFSAFAEALNRGTNCIVENGNLIKKLAFPSEVLPLNVALVGMVTMVFGILIFVLAAFATPVWMPPGPKLVWIPLLMLLQLVFTYGILLFVSSLQVFLRDTLQVITVLVTVWMFATPIFWAPELIPNYEVELAPYMPYIKANPMFHLVYAYRDVLMSAEPHQVFNHHMPTSVGIFALWAFGVFLGGYAFFALCQRRFADEV